MTSFLNDKSTKPPSRPSKPSCIEPFIPAIAILVIGCLVSIIIVIGYFLVAFAYINWHKADTRDERFSPPSEFFGPLLVGIPITVGITIAVILASKALKKITDEEEDQE